MIQAEINNDNNRLIAEFMNYEPSYTLIDVDKYRGNHNLSDFPMSKSDCEHDITHFSDRYGIDDQSMEIEAEEMKYHTSWDWLMPVVERCFCSLEDEGRDFDLHYDAIHDALWSINIEATYKAVVEFIKWYNENKKA